MKISGDTIRPGDVYKYNRECIEKLAEIDFECEERRRCEDGE